MNEPDGTEIYAERFWGIWSNGYERKAWCVCLGGGLPALELSTITTTKVNKGKDIEGSSLASSLIHIGVLGVVINETIAIGNAIINYHI